MKIFFSVLLAFLFVPILHFPVLAQLQFRADFNSDLVYEAEWTAFPGQTFPMDIYVSGVPEPGLSSFGFYLNYDGYLLDLGVEDILVDSDWFAGETADSWGQAEITGLRSPVEGRAGDDIRLVRVLFHAIDVGESQVWISDRGESVDDLVLAYPDGTVLDSDLGDGVLLGTVDVNRTGDFDGDGDVDGADLSAFADQYANCTEFCLANLDAIDGISSNDVFLLGQVFGTDEDLQD